MEVTVSLFPKFSDQPDTRFSSDLFDPNLQRINSVNSLTALSDSIMGSPISSPADSADYANIVGKIIRFRFKHGYSYYNFGHNYVAKLAAPILNKNLSAIVIPDDILKYPLAACSQQSIVGMKILSDKGFRVRPVGFYDSIIGGHFCYEVYYGKKWHFYDPNREPDETILNNNNRPGIEELNADPDLLAAAYPKDSRDFVMALYSTYQVGKEGKLPGANARLFQQGTKFLSYSLWLFTGLAYLILDKRYFSKK